MIRSSWSRSRTTVASMSDISRRAVSFWCCWSKWMAGVAGLAEHLERRAWLWRFDANFLLVEQIQSFKIFILSSPDSTRSWTTITAAGWISRSDACSLRPENNPVPILQRSDDSKTSWQSGDQVQVPYTLRYFIQPSAWLPRMRSVSLAKARFRYH